MYTQCSSCNVIFAMTEEDLDAHQGLVRCGRCGEVFNASWNLVDSIPEQQPTGLKTETRRASEDAISTPVNIDEETDGFVLDDAVEVSEDALDLAAHNLPFAADHTDAGADEVDWSERSPEQREQEGSAVNAVGHTAMGDVLETAPRRDIDLTDEHGHILVEQQTNEYETGVGSAHESYVNKQDDGLDMGLLPEDQDPGASETIEVEAREQATPNGAAMDGAMEFAPAVDGLDPSERRQTMGSDDDDDPSAIGNIDQTHQIEGSTVADATPHDVKTAATSTESNGDASNNLIIDEIQDPVVIEALRDEVESVIMTEDETPESTEEELAMDELSSLLTDDGNPYESLLIPEVSVPDDLDSTLSGDNELSLEDLVPSTPAETVRHETESSVAYLTDLVDPHASKSTNHEDASESLGSLANKESANVDDTNPKTETETGALAEDFDSFVEEDKNAAVDQRDGTELSSGPGPIFPDVEPEEIIIEAPTRLWKMDEETGDDLAGSAPQTETTGQAVPVAARQSPRSGRRGIPYSVWLTTWLLGSILLLFGLVWQIKDHYLVDLAQVPSLREPLNYMCKYLWCSVPSRTEIKAIDLVGTGVDPHPVAPGALRVSANLINRANFTQEFPPLEITLTDKEGNVVGRRTYLPHEYRGGAPNQMLPNVLERADFDLAQPAESAVGYEIQLVAR